MSTEVSDTKKLVKTLSYHFENEELLLQALTHKSASKVDQDYERLEFVGDAVLDLVIADILLKLHPKAKEGDLSKMRAALVNTHSLALAAKEISLSSYIRLSKSELAQDGADRPSILADVFEAIMGAIYLDSGYNAAYKVIDNLFSEKATDITPTDPKTELQELLHTKGKNPPEYLLDRTEGPEHALKFVTLVKIDDDIYGRGEGSTKKASQQKAAAIALEKIRNE